MTFLKVSAFVFGFAILGIACGSNNDGGGKTDGPVISHPGTGGAVGTGGGVGTGGATGTGGSTSQVDSGAGGSVVDGAVDSNVVVDATRDSLGGETGPSAKDIHLQIINAATSSVGLDPTLPTPVPYTSCK